jgi:regulatory protein
MGVITALEVQKRNRERVNVYLDGEYRFSVNLMDAAHLRKGQTLTDEEIARLRAEDAVVKAVESAVRFLAYRPRSISEVRRNLIEKSIDEPVIDQAVEQLARMGYLDDEAFARFWVENRAMFKPLSPTALRYELRQKGVSDTIIQSVLSDLDPAESAYKAASGQIKRLKHSDRRTFRTRISNFLQRRGFQYAVIREVIERLEEELGDEDYFTEAEDDDAL